MTGADLIAALKKHPLGVVCAVVVIASGAVLYLHSSAIAESQAESDARAGELAKMEANIRNATNLPEQVAEIQGLTKELDGRLMRAGQLAVNLQYFYKLEAETEVKLGDVRQTGTPKNTGNKLYVGVPFAVTVQGPFPQVTNFLTRLQNGRHFCRVLSANFSKAGGDNSTNNDVVAVLSLELLGQP